MELVSGERALTGEITLLPAPGHAPGRRGLPIASAGGRAVIPGDAAHHPRRPGSGWSPGFDGDGDLAAAPRRRMMDRLEAGGDLVAAASSARSGPCYASSASSARPTAGGSPGGM